MIDTEGAVIGQVNGLTVRDLGDHAFGAPARVTARTSIGRRGLTGMSFICIPPGSAVVYRAIVYVIAYLMAGLVLARR